ncbi:hypothetical protein P43SY_005182 [Pythium insidiosum]|uniref:CBF1-interacting co-repressor CIR N-terminal domain-containing protein n=1 Tax=Pythium insidiosum TaxID=114742 RepID=A0AAD5M3P7_PYTIN|nr:hypothetical protein P43SY_005182 [Pythium insidiosum]
MSLAFLAKKSWHTSNLRNVEKVWIAEQKHAAEEKKLAELRKNMEEERQLQELRKLQAAHGKKAESSERLEWMYQGPMASGNSERTAEEYLLGKEYKPTEAAADARKLGDSAYGALAMNKAALPANDTFSRLNEDPMMLIRKQQKSAHEDILKNPVKMKKIKAEVEKMLKEKKEMKKAKKKLKKEAKKERKSTRESRDRSTSSADSESERGHGHPQAEIDRKRDVTVEARAPSSTVAAIVLVAKTANATIAGVIAAEVPTSEPAVGILEVTAVTTQAKTIDRTTLGPSTDFLKQAREKKRREEEEIQRKLGKSSQSEVRMSHDEMMKRAAQMAEDAKARENYLEKRAAEKKERLDEEEQKLRKDPHFLKQLQDAAYTQSDASVEDRLRRNAHYIQKRADASNFLSKHG